MENNEMRFLDTIIYLDKNSNLQIKNFAKPDSQSAFMDYKSVCPKRIKNSIISTEVYRMASCSSTETDLVNSLNTLAEKFERHNFPKPLVRNKIDEIVARNFQKSKFLQEQNEKIKNLDYEQKHVVKLAYTSYRCSDIENKVRKIVKEYLPDFFVSFAFNNLNIRQKILPRLKPNLDMADVSHTNYKFLCDCNLSYIGESRLRLESRINQHRTSKTSAIFQHIQTCPNYADSLKQNFTNQPSDSELRKHLFSHFKILTKNRFSATSRKLSEGLFITISQPELNRQVIHKKCLLFCSCLSEQIPPDKAVCNQSP